MRHGRARAHAHPVYVCTNEQVLRFAAGSKAMAAQLAASVRGHARDWARQWGLGDAQAYELYMAAAQLLKVRALLDYAACVCCACLYVHRRHVHES